MSSNRKKPIRSHRREPELRSQSYEIRILGELDRGFWADCFSEMEFCYDPDRSETILRGTIAAQADLYGLLFRLRNTSLILTSVRLVMPQQKTELSA